MQLLAQSFLEGPKNFVLGPARVECYAQRLGMPDRYAGLRISGYLADKIQTAVSYLFASCAPEVAQHDSR